MLELQAGGSIYSFITGDGFDNEKDTEKIEEGYQLYEELKYTYSYLHH